MLQQPMSRPPSPVGEAGARVDGLVEGNAGGAESRRAAGKSEAAAGRDHRWFSKSAGLELALPV